MIVFAAARLSRRARRRQWNGPAYNPAPNLLYAPAVDWCATFSSFEQVRYIPGQIYMGGRTDLNPPSKVAGLADRGRRVDRQP